MEDPATMVDSPQWELVNEVPAQDVTDRMRVNGGYIYRNRVQAGATTRASGQVAVALVFVPDIQ
jgi:hypothetical protein